MWDVHLCAPFTHGAQNLFFWFNLWVYICSRWNGFMNLLLIQFQPMVTSVFKWNESYHVLSVVIPMSWSIDFRIYPQVMNLTMQLYRFLMFKAFPCLSLWLSYIWWDAHVLGLWAMTTYYSILSFDIDVHYYSALVDYEHPIPSYLHDFSISEVILVKSWVLSFS